MLRDNAGSGVWTQLSATPFLDVLDTDVLMLVNMAAVIAGLLVFWRARTRKSAWEISGILTGMMFGLLLLGIVVPNSACVGDMIIKCSVLTSLLLGFIRLVRMGISVSPKWVRFKDIALKVYVIGFGILLMLIMVWPNITCSGSVFLKTSIAGSIIVFGLLSIIVTQRMKVKSSTLFVASLALIANVASGGVISHNATASARHRRKNHRF